MQNSVADGKYGGQGKDKFDVKFLGHDEHGS